MSQVSKVDLNAISFPCPPVHLLGGQLQIEPHLFACSGHKTLQDMGTLPKKVKPPMDIHHKGHKVTFVVLVVNAISHIVLVFFITIIVMDKNFYDDNNDE